MKRRFSYYAVTVLAVIALINVVLAFPSPASANAAVQIAGIGYWSQPGECTAPQGQGASYSLKFTGSLKGCLYTFIVTSSCSAGGTYVETGNEVFVGDGSGNDSFQTTYRYEAKYQNCAQAAGEYHGFCDHPIVVGSGKGIFEGVNGWFTMRDDVAAGNFPYTGHLQY